MNNLTLPSEEEINAAIEEIFGEDQTVDECEPLDISGILDQIEGLLPDEIRRMIEDIKPPTPEPDYEEEDDERYNVSILDSSEDSPEEPETPEAPEEPQEPPEPETEEAMKYRLLYQIAGIICHGCRDSVNEKNLRKIQQMHRALIKKIHTTPTSCTICASYLRSKVPKIRGMRYSNNQIPHPFFIAKKTPRSRIRAIYGEPL